MITIIPNIKVSLKCPLKLFPYTTINPYSCKICDIHVISC